MDWTCWLGRWELGCWYWWRRIYKIVSLFSMCSSAVPGRSTVRNIVSCWSWVNNNKFTQAHFMPARLKDRFLRKVKITSTFHHHPVVKKRKRSYKKSFWIWWVWFSVWWSALQLLGITLITSALFTSASITSALFELLKFLLREQDHSQDHLSQRDDTER